MLITTGTDCQDCGPVEADNFTRSSDDYYYYDDDTDYYSRFNDFNGEDFTHEDLVCKLKIYYFTCL